MQVETGERRRAEDATMDHGEALCVFLKGGGCKSDEVPASFHKFTYMGYGTCKYV
jgi:hypothetical protein